MNTYGIDEKVYVDLQNYFSTNQDIEEVILFGSRATGLAKYNSDIDLCIRYNGSTPGTLIEEIDKIVGIYSCDIVFEKTLHSEIKYQIERDGCNIYKTI